MPLEQLVDVGAGIEKLVRNHQGGHQDQPFVANGAVLLHQAIELDVEIVGDLCRADELRSRRSKSGRCDY